MNKEQREQCLRDYLIPAAHEEWRYFASEELPLFFSDTMDERCGKTCNRNKCVDSLANHTTELIQKDFARSLGARMKYEAYLYMTNHSSQVRTIDESPKGSESVRGTLSTASGSTSFLQHENVNDPQDLLSARRREEYRGEKGGSDDTSLPQNSAPQAPTGATTITENGTSATAFSSEKTSSKSSASAAAAAAATSTAQSSKPQITAPLSSNSPITQEVAKRHDPSADTNIHQRRGKKSTSEDEGNTNERGVNRSRIHGTGPTDTEGERIDKDQQAEEVSGGAVAKAWTPQKQYREFHKIWLSPQGSNPKIREDPLVTNSYTQGLSDDDSPDDKVAYTLAVILEKMATAAQFESNSSLRAVFDWLMVYLLPFMRCNSGSALKKMAMKNPQNTGGTSTAGELYQVLLQSGFIPLSYELNSPDEKPQSWVGSKTHDFMSMLRQQVCVYARNANGDYVYFYDPQTVNKFVIPVHSRGSSLEEEYLISDSTQKQEEQNLRQRGTVLLDQSADNKLQHIVDKRRRKLQRNAQNRARDLMRALESMRKNLNDVLPNESQLKELVEMMYACNGVDVKTGEVKENVGQWLKSYSIDDDNCLEDICQPLTGQTEAASLGINKKKDPHRYEALNYSFRVVPEIANWRLRDVWASAKPDNAWSTAMPLKNVIRDIRNDVNETRVQAQESL